MWIADITYKKNDKPYKDSYLFNTIICACDFVKKLCWKEKVLEAHIYQEKKHE